MNKENAIEVRDLKKKFKIYFDKGHMLKERIIFANRNKHEDRWVLNGISFDVKKGEAIGLIGKNGCGKSTTLKLLNRIIYPNGGSIEIEGKVSSLIELGAGFHEDMTGRENIYINASIFGLTKKQIDERLDDIIRFSELEEFIDNPVRTYSSGMYMRLAFSVAINVDADVLLIDEILAVGDVNFQEKCFQKLKDVKRNGTTIVIVSHSLGQIEKICDRVIWIEKGLIKEDGLPRVVNKHYLEKMEYNRLERAEQEYVMQKEAEERKRKEEEKVRAQASEEKKQEEQRRKIEEERNKRNASCREICEQCGPDARREGNGKVEYTKIRMCNEAMQETTKFSFGDKIVLEMEYANQERMKYANFIIGITRTDWVYCFGSTSEIVNGSYSEIKEKGKVKFVIETNNLTEGSYYLDVRIKSESDEVYDNLFCLITFKVTTDKKYGWGTTAMKNSWIIE